MHLHQVPADCSSDLRLIVGEVDILHLEITRGVRVDAPLFFSGLAEVVDRSTSTLCLVVDEICTFQAHLQRVLNVDRAAIELSVAVFKYDIR